MIHAEAARALITVELELAGFKVHKVQRGGRMLIAEAETLDQYEALCAVLAALKLKLRDTTYKDLVPEIRGPKQYGWKVTF
jgi:hypothetical protein